MVGCRAVGEETKGVYEVDEIPSVFTFFADTSSPESSSAFRFTALAVAVEAMGGGAIERLLSAVLPPLLAPPLPPPRRLVL